MLFIFMFFISWIPIYFIRCSALCGVKLNKEGTEKDVKLKFVTSLEANLKRLQNFGHRCNKENYVYFVSCKNFLTFVITDFSINCLQTENLFQVINSLNKLCVFTLTLLAHRSMSFSMRTLKSLKYVNFSEDCHWFPIISIRKYHCNPMNNVFYKLCEFGSTQTFLYIQLEKIPSIEIYRQFLTNFARIVPFLYLLKTSENFF